MADAGGKMSAETVDPETDRFAAHDGTTFCEQILDIRCAQREAIL